MARIDLTATQASRTGTTVNPVTAAITDGHAFVNNGRRVLLIKNANATLPRTVEIPLGTLVDGQTPPAKVVTVPAASTVVTNVFPHEYNQSTGKVHINYPVITDLTIQVVEVSRV